MSRDDAHDDGTAITRAHLERIARGEQLAPEIMRAVNDDPELSHALESIRSENELLDELVGAVTQRTGQTPQLHDDELVEGYEIIREIARGSQGIVVEAIQNSTHRRVALKLLLRGTFATSRERERFEREVELVAAMPHPGIVTVYDSGLTSGGRAFVAMEFIEGCSLSEWATRTLSDPPDASEIRLVLDMIAQLCDAVNFAHQRGIMHRDLKPGNILVRENGQPCVLDFGLAREVDRGDRSHQMQATRAGEFLGTFAYAAPEQLRGDPLAIDVRADVYALGAMLYELLTTALPHDLDGDYADVFERLTNTEPTRPRFRNSAIPHDVETIIRSAMALDPARRYQSAGALRDDIRRYLDGYPIDARRDSQLYVFRRWLARNKVRSALGAIAILALASIPIVWMTQQQLVIIRSKQYEVTGERLINAFAQTNWAETDDRVSIASFLDNVAREAEGNLPDDPAFQARFWSALGLANLSIPPFDDAAHQLARALEIERSISAEPRPLLAQRMFDLARVYWSQANYDDARALYTESLEMRRLLFGEEHEDIARTLSHLAACDRGQGRAADAEPRYRAALEMRVRLAKGQRSPDVTNSRNSLALCLLDLGRYHDAASTFEVVLEEFRALYDDWERNWRFARILNNHGRCLRELGRLDDAETALTTALEIKTYYHENQAHPDVARTQVELAETRLARGRLDDAADLANAALETYQRAYAAAHDDTARAWQTLGRVRLAQHETADAESAFDAARAMLVETRPAGHWTFAELDSDRAACALNLDDAERAMTLVRPAAALLLSQRPLGDNRQILALERLITAARALGATEVQSEAEQRLREAIAAREASSDPLP